MRSCLNFLQVSFAAVSLALLSSILLVPSAEAATNYTDADILQFALNLEVRGLATASVSKTFCQSHLLQAVVHVLMLSSLSAFENDTVSVQYLRHL